MTKYVSCICANIQTVTVIRQHAYFAKRGFVNESLVFCISISIPGVLRNVSVDLFSVVVTCFTPDFV